VILLTHRHQDHLLGADTVRERYGAPVWGDASISDRVKLDRKLPRRRFRELAGPHPRRLVAYATPGTRASHFAFLEERSRTLIAETGLDIGNASSIARREHVEYCARSSGCGS